MVVTNTSIKISWPTPPGSFLGGSTVDNYQVIMGPHPGKIFKADLVPVEIRNLTASWLEPLKNYTYKVIAILKDGKRGSISWKRFQTTEGSKR